MNRNKIAITLALIAGLLIILILIAIALVVIFTQDVLYWSDGIISLLAFVLAAFIFGYCTNFVVDYIKRIWS